jgi:hypothetical protein
MGLRQTITAADGSFRVVGVAESVAQLIAAEHKQVGRALPQKIAPGSDDVTVELALVPFGGLEGTVTANGEPASNATVMVMPDGANTPIIVNAGDDGRYTINALAAGPYKLLAFFGATPGLGGGTSASRDVTVTPGKPTHVDVDIALGEVTLTVAVSGKDGARVDAAQVFLFEGARNFSTAKQLTDAVTSQGQGDGMRMGFALGVKPAEFAKLVPGDYSVCVLPITGDLSDPTFAQRLQQHSDLLQVHCSEHAVPAQPAAQRLEIAVPAMVPLPDTPAPEAPE